MEMLPDHFWRFTIVNNSYVRVQLRKNKFIGSTEVDHLTLIPNEFADDEVLVASLGRILDRNVAVNNSYITINDADFTNE